MVSVDGFVVSASVTPVLETGVSPVVFLLVGTIVGKAVVPGISCPSKRDVSKIILYFLAHPKIKKVEENDSTVNLNVSYRNCTFQGSIHPLEQVQEYNWPLVLSTPFRRISPLHRSIGSICKDRGRVQRHQT